MTIIIGTAGWAVPRANAEAFAGEGSALQRYASQFCGAEVNSSFHRPHRRSTWERWGESVPAGFRFSAKIPKTISHERKLVDCAGPLARFLEEVAGLGDKLFVLLLQLPPKLGFEASVAEGFLQMITSMTQARIACEPRHPTWFGDDADNLLQRYRIARVAADPAITMGAANPGGWRGFDYHRLHGSPSIYRSSYDDGRLEAIAHAVSRDIAPDRSVWCIFDNTASGAATSDALRLAEMLDHGGP